MRHYKKTGQAGFTLLEIMLVVMIIGLLVTVAAIKIGPQAQKARIGTAQQQIKNYASGIDLFMMDTGSYPSTEQGLDALIAAPGNAPNWRGPYLDPAVIRDDPWGSKYIYRYPGEKNTAGPDISSPGPNRAPGDDDDIGNWM
jgi:general secretion pathway protein G